MRPSIVRLQQLLRSSEVRSALKQHCHRRQCTTDSKGLIPAIRALFVDTMSLMKNLEKIGFPREQAEHLTNQMTELVENTREKMSLKFVLTESLDKALMEQEARILAFKSELQKAQDMHLSAVTKDTERLQGSLEKMRTDVKHDIDKLTASQRLDLNLEKGRMRDELQTLRDKSVDLELKMDREINALKAAIEQTKNETIKYVVAILGTFVAAGIGIARIVSH